jgi:hypothetical protein
MAMGRPQTACCTKLWDSVLMKIVVHEYEEMSFVEMHTYRFQFLFFLIMSCIFYFRASSKQIRNCEIFSYYLATSE